MADASGSVVTVYSGDEDETATQATNKPWCGSDVVDATLENLPDGHLRETYLEEWHIAGMEVKVLKREYMHSHSKNSPSGDETYLHKMGIRPKNDDFDNAAASSVCSEVGLRYVMGCKLRLLEQNSLDGQERYARGHVKKEYETVVNHCKEKGSSVTFPLAGSALRDDRTCLVVYNNEDLVLLYVKGDQRKAFLPHEQAYGAALKMIRDDTQLQSRGTNWNQQLLASKMHGKFKINRDIFMYNRLKEHPPSHQNQNDSHQLMKYDADCQHAPAPDQPVSQVTNTYHIHASEGATLSIGSIGQSNSAPAPAPSAFSPNTERKLFHKLSNIGRQVENMPELINDHTTQEGSRTVNRVVEQTTPHPSRRNQAGPPPSAEFYRYEGPLFGTPMRNQPNEREESSLNSPEEAFTDAVSAEEEEVENEQEQIETEQNGTARTGAIWAELFQDIVDAWNKQVEKAEKALKKWRKDNRLAEDGSKDDTVEEEKRKTMPKLSDHKVDVYRNFVDFVKNLGPLNLHGDIFEYKLKSMKDLISQLDTSDELEASLENIMPVPIAVESPDCPDFIETLTNTLCPEPNLEHSSCCTKVLLVGGGKCVVYLDGDDRSDGRKIPEVSDKVYEFGSTYRQAFYKETMTLIFTFRTQKDGKMPRSDDVIICVESEESAQAMETMSVIVATVVPELCQILKTGDNNVSLISLRVEGPQSENASELHISTVALEELIEQKDLKIEFSKFRISEKKETALATSKAALSFHDCELEKEGMFLLTGEAGLKVKFKGKYPSFASLQQQVKGYPNGIEDLELEPSDKSYRLKKGEFGKLKDFCRAAGRMHRKIFFRRGRDAKVGPDQCGLTDNPRATYKLGFIDDLDFTTDSNTKVREQCEKEWMDGYRESTEKEASEDTGASKTKSKDGTTPQTEDTVLAAGDHKENQPTGTAGMGRTANLAGVDQCVPFASPLCGTHGASLGSVSMEKKASALMEVAVAASNKSKYSDLGKDSVAFDLGNNTGALAVTAVPEGNNATSTCPSFATSPLPKSTIEASTAVEVERVTHTAATMSPSISIVAPKGAVEESKGLEVARATVSDIAPIAILPIAAIIAPQKAEESIDFVEVMEGLPKGIKKWVLPGKILTQRGRGDKACKHCKTGICQKHKQMLESDVANACEECASESLCKTHGDLVKKLIKARTGNG